MAHVKRREFISLLGGATVVWPLAARAQQKPRVVGFLGANTPVAAGHMTSAFVTRLRDLGWIEGRNVVIEYRWAAGQTAKFRELAAELVAAGADVIVTSGNAPAIAARQATSSVPIVLASSADIMATGLVKSLARPGGNVTGLTVAADDTAGKRLELLREAVPGLNRIAVLFNPDAGRVEVSTLREVAPAVGVVLDVFEFRTTGDLDRIAAYPDRSVIGGLFVVSDPLVFTNRVAINAFAIREKLPSVHRLREYVDDGGLMSYGPDFRVFFRRAADYVDKIFKGTRAEDLPVEQPTIFHLVINLKTAKAIGLVVPPILLSRADEVIE
jgi:putative tryptophan/tyrosine transport system substrate-binding protein